MSEVVFHCQSLTAKNAEVKMLRSCCRSSRADQKTIRTLITEIKLITMKEVTRILRAENVGMFGMVTSSQQDSVSDGTKWTILHRKLKETESSYEKLVTSWSA